MVSTVNAPVIFTTTGHVTCIGMHVDMHAYVNMTKHKHHYKYTKQNRTT